MERHQLIALLAGPGEANRACRTALQRGAEFTITAGTTPADHLATIYARRERHCRERGVPTVGFHQGVERLQAAQDRPVRLGWVDVTSPPYRFQLFLAEDAPAVLACIGVGRAHRNVAEPTD